MAMQIMPEKRCRICGSFSLFSLKDANEHVFRCQNCDIVYRLYKKNGNHYINKIKQHYSKVDPEVNVAESRKKLYEKFFNDVDHFNFQGRKILDVGCGYGYFLNLARKRRWKINGIEIAEELAEKGKYEYGIDIQCLNFEKAHHHGNQYDVVTLWNVVDAMEEPARCIDKINDLLAPGGMLFIRTPNASFHVFLHKVTKLLERLRLVWILPRQSFLFHRYTFSQKALSWLLINKGFRTVIIKNSPPTSKDPYSVKKGVRVLKPMCFLVAQVIYTLSCKKYTIAPSLEVFASRGYESQVK
jgi:2-polyprenyl-3-methyl-5-hydroxy-6-metoxy-1,4-benzoquinol methylase